jgi:cytoskeletal protein CcmA (bactofilin family)
MEESCGPSSRLRPNRLPLPTTAAKNATPSRSPVSLSRSSARLVSGLQIKGEIAGSEDLQIDGIVQGPVSLNGHVLTVGCTAQLSSEIHAGEVVINCARISIEDGAHFKGHIEIDPERSKNTAS